jgi:hypothetical protein
VRGNIPPQREGKSITSLAQTVYLNRLAKNIEILGGFPMPFFYILSCVKAKVRNTRLGQGHPDVLWYHIFRLSHKTIICLMVVGGK